MRCGLELWYAIGGEGRGGERNRISIVFEHIYIEYAGWEFCLIHVLVMIDEKRLSLLCLIYSDFGNYICLGLDIELGCKDFCYEVEYLSCKLLCYYAHTFTEL